MPFWRRRHGNQGRPAGEVVTEAALDEELRETLREARQISATPSVHKTEPGAHGR
jgi:hypothetical protein